MMSGAVLRRPDPVICVWYVSSMRIRAILGAAALVLIAAGSFQPMYLRIFTVDSDAMRAGYTELPYRRLPGLRTLLWEADVRTPRGATIALWAPFREWDGGYGYAFRRAPFLMPDKQIVPMLEPDRDQLTLRYLAGARYLICWRGCPPIGGFKSMWRSADGELMVRAR
jgi:hypothetical protein